jgi:hypothetical protein
MPLEKPLHTTHPQRRGGSRPAGSQQQVVLVIVAAAQAGPGGRRRGGRGFRVERRRAEPITAADAHAIAAALAARHERGAQAGCRLIAVGAAAGRPGRRGGAAGHVRRVFCFFFVVFH